MAGDVGEVVLAFRVEPPLQHVPSNHPRSPRVGGVARALLDGRMSTINVPAGWFSVELRWFDAVEPGTSSGEDLVERVLLIARLGVGTHRG